MTHPPYETLTLTVEREFDTISFTQPTGSIFEFMLLVKKMALAMGYHSTNWDDAILEAADEIRQNQRLHDASYEDDEPST